MKRFSLSIKSHDESGFTGYGSVFYLIDRHADVITPGAFKGCVDNFLAEGFIGGVGHDHDRPIGKPVEAYEDAKGLFLRAKFSDVPAAHEARTLIKDRVVNKLSIGFEPETVQIMDEKGVKSLWQAAQYQPTRDDLRRLKKADYFNVISEVRKLFEVSPVTIPANDLCDITGVKTAPAGTARYLERVANQFDSYLKIDAKSGIYARADGVIDAMTLLLEEMKSARKKSYQASPEYLGKLANQAQALKLKIQIERMRNNA